MLNVIKISPEDNCAVALQPIDSYVDLQIEDDHAKGIRAEETHIDKSAVKTNSVIPQGHKLAIAEIAKGSLVIKYGSPIGIATEDIAIGDHIHTHNIKTTLSDNLEYRYRPNLKELPFKKEDRYFQGFRRDSGDIGIRNELWIIPTVGCVNGQANRIKELIREKHPYQDVVVFGHPYGCSQLGEDHNNTKMAIASMIKHPNAGGVLVLGLGCENNQISELKETVGSYNSSRVKFLIAQEVEDEIECGVDLAEQLIVEINSDKRTECCLSELKIGLKCGGSDGLSGITANPLVGQFSDWLITQGGTTVLTEVPEMFGAETLLMERCRTEEIFNDSVEMINGFKDYFRANNQTIYENPSPGNKEGGISTLEDKSLGCTQKGGSATVIGVINYGEQIKERGLNLLWSPGNDLVAASALGFAGCHIVLFTTGRGTPFGSFIPTMKISTNNELYNHKRKWIDFNAGELVTGKSMETLREELTDYITSVASGEKLNHEKVGFKEISIFKSGVTL